MKKSYTISLLFLFLISLYTQSSAENNCQYGEQAKIHIRKARELQKTAKSERDFLAVVTEYQSALKYNSKCETIQLAIAETYAETGKINSRYFNEAKSYLNNIIYSSSDSDNISEAKKVLSQINIVENAIKEERVIAERRYQLRLEERRAREEMEHEIRKQEKEKNKDYDSFFSLGTGYGLSYGQMGIKASLFVAPDRLMLTGSVGYPISYFNDKSVPLLWSTGLGFSFGTYRKNFQLIIQYYGKIESRKDYYEKALGLNFAANFDLFSSNFGINFDVGYYLTIESDNIEIKESRIAEIFGLPGIGIPGLGLSAGLYYKF